MKDNVNSRVHLMNSKTTRWHIALTAHPFCFTLCSIFMGGLIITEDMYTVILSCQKRTSNSLKMVKSIEENTKINNKRILKCVLFHKLSLSYTLILTAAPQLTWSRK